VVGFAVALVPALRDSAREGAEAVQRERAVARAQLVRELETEQRPRFERSSSVAPVAAPARRQLVSRAALLDDLVAAITSDARARVRRGELAGRIRRAECEPFPRNVDGTGVEDDLTRRRGRYACLAVTSEFEGGLLGHQYRALVDFVTGRFAFCKVSGQSGPSRDQLVTTPRVCGG
jgi:hypothetical protein